MPLNLSNGKHQNAHTGPVFKRLTQMIVHVHIRCTVFFTVEFQMICKISLGFHLLLIVLQLKLMAGVAGCMHLENMTNGDWVVSYGKGFRANIILWGMPRDVSTLEVRDKLADLGLASFVRGK